MCAALDGGSLAMARDHANALVDPRRDVIRRAALQESDAVVAAGGVDATVLWADRAFHPRHRRRDVGIDADRVVWVAAGFDEGPHRVGGFRLAQQDAMRAAAEDLAKLPGVVTHMGGVDSIHRR